MKRFSLATAALMAAAVNLPAIAADMPVKSYAPPAPVYSWSGCYVGAGGGYGFWRQDNVVLDAITRIPIIIGQTAGGSGAFGTVQVGCDYQWSSSWVIGAFADYNFANLKGELGTLGLGIIGTEKMTSKWAAGGRIGWLPFERLMTFVSAGYTQARFDTVNFTGGAGGIVVDTLPAQTYSGFFVGSGVEYSLAWLPGLTWKTEYRYSDFRKVDTNILTVPGNAALVGLNTHKSSQEVRSELVWRFGGGAVVAKY
jgi:outer membrane immunogenic protein